MTALPFLDAQALAELVSVDAAREAIAETLNSGFDPAGDPHRIHQPAGAGHLLLMPSATARWVGVKLATVAPENPERGLPRIHAVYTLMDSETLTPRLQIDGSALTSLRTPAVTAAVADRLAAPKASRLVVFGAGPQGVEHAIALSRIRELSQITIVARRPGTAEAAAEQLRERGLPASAGGAEAVNGADLIVTATSAAEPVLDDALVAEGACVLAIGAHEPSHRELPGALMGRAQVVVEDRSAALREAGDVVLAIDEGHLAEGDLLPMRELLGGTAGHDPSRPNVFKGTGMSWQDLAVAAVAARS